MLEILHACWDVFCLIINMAIITAQKGVGILGDFFDTIGIIGKAIATIGAVIGLLIALNHERWYISRKKK